jgi:hypothetical protein
LAASERKEVNAVVMHPRLEGLFRRGVAGVLFEGRVLMLGLFMTSE